MSPLFNRRAMLRATAAAASALVLPQAQACEFFATTLRIWHPWSRASLPGATDAVVCMRLDEVRLADRLIGVETPLASGADLAGLKAGTLSDLLIPAGQETLLSEDSTYLRLTGLQQALEVGCAYPLKLVFEHGGTVNAQLSIDFGGQRFS